MKKFISGLIIVFVVIIGVVVAGPFYIINEGEQAVVVRFGQVVSYTRNAGLHVKVPFVDQVVRYQRRIMTWDGAAQFMPTLEQQFIFVDVTARWRIADPVLFYVAITTVDAGHLKLSEIIDSAVRTVVAENHLREMVRNSNHIITQNVVTAEVLGIDEEIDFTDPLAIGDEIDVAFITAMIQPQGQQEPIARGRRELSEEVLERSRPIAIDQYGIELIDVVTRQVRYTDELTRSVYDRMIRERGQIAEYFRSLGQGRYAYWLGRTESELREILSIAYRDSEVIRGGADAEATRIFAQAHMRNQGFFDFWRAIESYRVTMPNFTTMISTDPEYFRFLFSPN